MATNSLCPPRCFRQLFSVLFSGVGGATLKKRPHLFVIPFPPPCVPTTSSRGERREAARGLSGKVTSRLVPSPFPSSAAVLWGGKRILGERGERRQRRACAAHPALRQSLPPISIRKLVATERGSVFVFSVARRAAFVHSLLKTGGRMPFATWACPYFPGNGGHFSWRLRVGVTVEQIASGDLEELESNGGV